MRRRAPLAHQGLLASLDHLGKREGKETRDPQESLVHQASQDRRALQGQRASMANLESQGCQDLLGVLEEERTLDRRCR